MKDRFPAPYQRLKIGCIPENQQMSMEFPAEMKSKFAEMNYGMIPVTLFDRSQLSKILDAVRQKVLDFALQLENSGILGSEDYMFSKDEKAKAHNLITINQIHGTQIIQQELITIITLN